MCKNKSNRQKKGTYIVIVIVTAACAAILGYLLRPLIEHVIIEPATANRIVITFFVVVLAVCIIGGILIAVFFVVAYSRNETKAEADPDYLFYLHKGVILRVCYGICVAADLLLSLIGIVATGLGAYIVLIPGTDNTLVAVLLITSFVATSIRSALNLKNLRAAYAKAFRELEFALDSFRICDKKDDAKKALCEANKRAQSYIESFFE